MVDRGRPTVKQGRETAGTSARETPWRESVWTPDQVGLQVKLDNSLQVQSNVARKNAAQPNEGIDQLIYCIGYRNRVPRSSALSEWHW